MALKNQKFPPLLADRNLRSEIPLHQTEFKDTDPEMLFALWEMEQGVDPDQSLETVQNATVLYDKFRPRISRRHR